MAFPADPLPIRQEMMIGGVWTDVTARTRNDADVVITRGSSSEQASLSAGQCRFTLNNRDRYFSNRSPQSVNYGQIGRNAPFRTSIVEDDPFMKLADYSDADGFYDQAHAWTSDKAVLDIVGDIDVRWDVEPDHWRGGEGFMLGGKYEPAGNQRSWAVFITPTGNVRITWSTDGTAAGRVTTTSTAAIPDAGRTAVRVTVDVNNGAGGNTVTFYTSDTIGGSWTILGAAVVNTGTTSIFSSSALLEVGTAAGAQGRGSSALFVNPVVNPFVGRIYGFELRSGIGGTLVADFDPTGRTPGDTTWSDGLGTPNTWTLEASAEITDANYRFWGEVPKLPQRWDPSGADVYSPAVAADLFRRLGQGSKPLDSAMFRNLTKSTLSGYWPGEDGSEATALSAYVGSTGKVFDGRFGSTDGFLGTAGSLTFSSDSGTASGSGVAGLSVTGTAYVLFSFKLPAVPGGSRSVMDFYYTGATARANITVTATTYTLTIYDSDGVSLATSNTAFGSGGEPNQWIAMRLRLVQNGGNVDWDWGWYAAGDDILFGVSGSYAGTVGRPRSWASPAWTDKSGAELAHIVLAREDIGFATFDFVNSVNGWTGETVSERFARLCQEQGVPYWVVGRLVDNSGDPVEDTMGPQTVKTFVDLITECVAVDGGFLYGPRDKFGIALRMRRSIYNRAALALDYSLNHLSGEFLPDEDDVSIRNDVTATRDGGGSARVVQTDGPLNVNDPADDPDGVGTYDTRIVRNVETDARLPAMAQQEKHLGTWDELRYPRVEVELARAPYLASAALTRGVRDTDLGDAVSIANLPAWMPPGGVDLMVRGYTETLRNRGHMFRWNTTPYGPYVVAELESASEPVRLDATNSALAGAVSDSATTLVVKTPTGARWRRSSGAVAGTYPLTAALGGEEVSVTAVADVTMTYVAAGTVSHGNNASVTPGLPAGLATGDLMVMLTAIRNTAGSATTPAGWTRLTGSSNVALFGRLAEASGNAPTVAFTGGVANADTSAQIAAFRPSAALSTTSPLTEWLNFAQWQTNASAQDIEVPHSVLMDSLWDNGIVLYLGWKQDDWTSVTGPGTEIGEPDTTTGDDQGIVWSYTIQTTRSDTAATSFVVTGGASAVSASAVVRLHPRHQAFTVTRATNGITLAHAADTSISLAAPARVGL